MGKTQRRGVAEPPAIPTKRTYKICAISADGMQRICERCPQREGLCREGFENIAIGVSCGSISSLKDLREKKVPRG
jgi:hypothetical protein